MGRYKYSREITVPEYDCDSFLRLRPSVMLRYIQTVAGEHLETIDLDYETLFNEGFVFVVAGTALKIYRSPISGEKIVLSTAPIMGQGAHMMRETVIDSIDGERLVECQVNWALIDANSRKLLRASDFPHELPLLEGEWTPFFDPRKIRIKPVREKSAVRPVRLSDLDRNIHMNNTVYADVILDCFGEDYLKSGGVDTMFIRYHLQAQLGDELTLEYGFSDNTYSVGACCGDKHCFEGAFSLKPLESV